MYIYIYIYINNNMIIIYIYTLMHIYVRKLLWNIWNRLLKDHFNCSIDQAEGNLQHLREKGTF